MEKDDTSGTDEDQQSCESCECGYGFSTLIGNTLLQRLASEEKSSYAHFRMLESHGQVFQAARLESVWPRVSISGRGDIQLRGVMNHKKHRI